MELFNLGRVPWETSQVLYHALAELNRESLCLLSPATPYVCLGFHQDMEQEVDLEYCRTNRIPIFRREVGGGAVFLDGRQLFFQLILKRENPGAPLKLDAFYKKYLEPVIRVHRRIGIDVQYKPINDLLAGGRKISGTGAGDIGDSIVFVGNLILDFDYDTMSRVLKVPDEKFRDKVKKTIQDNLTTIRRELGEDAADRWSEDKLNAMLADAFSRVTGPMEQGVMDDRLTEKMTEIEKRMNNEEWLSRKGKRVPGRVVKVRSGLEVHHKLHKAQGGLMRVDYALEDGIFSPGGHFRGFLFFSQRCRQPPGILFGRPAPS